MRPVRLALLVVSLALVGGVAVGGSLVTETGTGSWYSTLDKPPWNPPGWTFGVVWTLLYIAMAVSAWLVARSGLQRAPVRVALGLYAAQLLLNFLWTMFFFGLEAPAVAFVDIVFLFALVLATIVAFRPISEVAAGLLVPYAIWIAYAASLNAWIVVAN